MMQVPTSSFDNISPTALLVAYARQFTDIPYGQELAQLVNAQAFVEQLQKQQSDKSCEVAVLFEGRYKAINQVMAQFQKTQILELASGLLPRGMVMSGNPSTTFIESDLPGMITRKQQLVKQLIGVRSNLHFIGIDATSQPSQFPIDVDYLDSQQPITVICEGLLLYLTLHQKKQVFANVRELLQVYGGVWITPDLITKEYLSRVRRNSPAWQKLSQTVRGMTATSDTDTIFDNFDQVRQFVREQGFQLQAYNSLNVLDQLTCWQPLGINPAVAESILADSFVFVLTTDIGS
ncbi:MAG: hypothetical protein F6K37_34805 [Moorea sp. SIO4E2]|uniref:class I SAM-dependent methyltransferase n=1 Tax=Moorena sp. SIO4E2 TaxID=2607826 RepID=UPI0013BD00F4|nr:class I SAM-dependent methyltransferase [Moorena sp. SIO4E2]NEQ10902.1 hypothetical protein [Moorena sp. SIO4E2]